MPTNKIQTGLRLEPDVLNKITVLANQSKRSKNNLLELIIKDYLRKYEIKNGVIDIQKHKDIEL